MDILGHKKTLEPLYTVNRESLLCGDSDKWALRYMEGWPYIRHISNDFDYALFDFSYCANEVFEIDEPCIFLGSHQNYGHWLLDFLPKLYVIEQFEHLKNLPIIVGELKEFQKESLELLGIDKNHPIIVIPKDKGLLYRFKKVFLSSKPPYGVVKDFYRKKLVKSIPRQGKGRRLYLSRKNQGVRNRVYNEDEVSAFLQILGFEVIFPERLSIRETVEIFSQTEMIVCSVGAEFSNIAFTDKCTLILLMSNSLIEGSEFSYVSMLQQAFTLCDYLKPVISKVKEEGVFNINYDVSEYRVQDIGRAIIEAEAALKKMVI